MSISGTTQGIRPGVCLSTNRPASPFTGQVIYMSDTDETAVWDGTAWEGLNRSRDRNVVINGAMQVAQRGTSVASLTTDGYRTADRWFTAISAMGTWTQSVENDAPTGSGFRKSLKMLCTTANASPSGTNNLALVTRFEGQNLQQFLKGTASAKQLSLSFWVKSNVTGTYVAELYDLDNSRLVNAQYTINASATWEKKTITFPADTTGAFDNDNALSFSLTMWLGAGSGLTSGTLQTTWATAVTANRAVGQTNLAAATNNYWQITGVQLEAGAVATPFEFEDYGVTLLKCQRYYQKSYLDATAPGSISTPGAVMLPYLPSGNTLRQTVFLKTRMRAAPNVTIYNPETGANGHMVAEGGGSNSAYHASAGVTFISESSVLVFSTNAPVASIFYFQYVAEKEL